MNNDDWDSLTVNPHHDAYEEGRKQGLAAGTQQGWKDGHHLGSKKGMEYGMELGFYRGILSFLANHKDLTERSYKTLAELQEMMNTFPNPDELFLVERSDTEKLDIAARMQRLRVKYKVLTVQMHLPHVTLKNILQEQQESLASSSEW